MEKLSIKKNYEIVAKISEGNFGTVFKAINKRTKEIVAIKKIFCSSSNKKQRSMIEREIEILNKCNHPNVIKMLGYKLKETSVTIIMEYAQSDLSTFLSLSSYPISSSKNKIILFQLLSGLSYLHSKSIVHRDLKPSNILLFLSKECHNNPNNYNDHKDVIDLSPSSYPSSPISASFLSSSSSDPQSSSTFSNFCLKIGDLGSASFQKEVFSIEGFTRWYKSPEIMFGSRNYGGEVDIWAVGCIFGEMLGGSVVFAGINEIDMIGKIGGVLGSPNEKNWKGILNLPDFGKINFREAEPKELKEVFPNATELEIDLLKGLLKYENRLTADEALKHKYFENMKPVQFKLKKEEKQNQFFNYLDLLKNDEA